MLCKWRQWGRPSRCPLPGNRFNDDDNSSSEESVVSLPLSPLYRVLFSSCISCLYYPTRLEMLEWLLPVKEEAEREPLLVCSLKSRHHQCCHLRRSSDARQLGTTQVSFFFSLLSMMTQTETHSQWEGKRKWSAESFYFQFCFSLLLDGVRNETVVKTAEANSFYNSTMTTFSWQATKIRPMGEYFLETKSQIWKKQGKKDERRLGKRGRGSKMG